MNPNFVTGLYLLLIGMGVVFSSLFILLGFIKLVALLSRLAGGREKSVAVPEREPEDLAAEEVALVSAAVVAALEAPIQIHRIRLMQDESQETWSRVGRLDIMRSHGRAGRS